MNVENEKCVIIVDENLPLGIIANTAAILGIIMKAKASIIRMAMRPANRQAEQDGSLSWE